MRSLSKGFQLATIILLLGLALGPAALPVQAKEPKAQPELEQAAAQQPDRLVTVIVQKTGKESGAEAAVAQLGGEVLRDLAIINAFTAEMPAAAALQLAKGAGVRWVSLDSTVRQAAIAPAFSTWATAVSPMAANTFTSPQLAVDSPQGPNDTYAYGAAAKGAFDGFVAEVTPEMVIAKVEVALRLYTSATPVTGQDPVISVTVGGKSSKTVVLSHSAFSACVGKTKACVVYADVTAARPWLWSDFDETLDLTVTIDQSSFKSGWTIYYDAVGLRVSDNSGTDPSDTVFDAGKLDFSRSMMTMQRGGDMGVDAAVPAIDTGSLANVYNTTVRATDTWNAGPGYQRGDGMTIAVVDSGIIKHNENTGRLIKSVNFNKAYHDSADRYGHGTFVGSIIAGNGSQSKKYIGIAPNSKLINVRVSDDNGAATESDVVASLQWILNNHGLYNIQVVNLSLNSSVAQSYHTAPLDAAVEILWFNGIVVVVSAGNNGTTTLYPPANDPFVITVGATDDKGTASLADDTVASFSAAGVAETGSAKPDLVAPGKNIIALLPDNARLKIGKDHPGNRVDAQYFRMSGTSMAAPMVSGAAALVLQSDPSLSPDQVKYRLIATANKNWAGYSAAKAGAGTLDIYAAVNEASTESANTGLPVSRLLTSGSAPVNGSVSWNSVSWNSVSWNSVSWNSVSWNSVSWNSDYWGN